MQKASGIYLATSAALFLPSFQAARAEVEIATDNLDEAENLLNQATSMMDASEENWCRAPVLGLQAVICQTKNQMEQTGDYLLQCKQVLEGQNALGLATMPKQKGLPS